MIGDSEDIMEIRKWNGDKLRGAAPGKSNAVWSFGHAGNA